MPKERAIQFLSERLRPGLNDLERKYLESAELGDEDIVQSLLESGSVSPDREDTQGRTALDLAIATGQQSLVTFLLEKVSPKVIHQGLLCAVENDRVEICENLLKHPLYQTPNHMENSNSNIYSSCEFISSTPNGKSTLQIPTDGMDNESVKSKTSGALDLSVEKMLKEALIKASIRNNFQIVQMIMLKGVSVDIPHDYFCSCEQCIYDQRKDYMVFCNRRLDTFRALASPAYIALTEEDPVMASFYLSKRFKQLQVVETEYQQTYRELDDQVQEFTLELLNQCRNSKEVRLLLEPSQEEDNGNRFFPMLQVALHMDQKKFVAHPKSQAQVSALWFSGLQIMRHLNRFEFLMLSIPLGMILLPLLSVVYVVAPWSKVTLLLNTPSTRFLSYTCSYITFLSLAVLCKIQFSNMWVSLGCEEQEPISIFFVVIIFMWIIGWIWEEVKQVYEAGAHDYFRSVWNIIDSLMLTFLLTSFTLDVVVPIRLSRSIRNHPLTFNVSGQAVDMTMLPFCYEENNGYLTSLKLCRIVSFGADWNPSWIPDPELIADVMFSAGIILSIARISFIMPANETFGTMLVSFRRTFGDVIKLCAMFILILLSFSCGLAALYAAHHCQTPHFEGFSGIFFLLIWSLLGFGPGEAPDLNRSAPMTSLTNNPSRISATEWFGYAIYGVYVFAALVVLMNLLIAVMSNTFQEVQDERDIEWKFARTELWMTFIEPGCPVAPPFNIFPTPKTFYKLWRKLRTKLSKSKCKKMKEDEEINREERTFSTKKTLSRQNVICTLIQRYIVHAAREKLEGDDDAAEDKIRRLIERTSSRIEKRLDEVQGHVNSVDSHVHNVHKGGKDIRIMQQAEMDLTHKVIAAQEDYRKLLREQWEEGKKFREERLKEVREMREQREKLLKQHMFEEARRLEESIADTLEEADFVPRTTIQY